MVYIIPTVLLTIINVKLWKTFKISHETHFSLTNQKPETDDVTLAMNIIAIETVFILCQTPGFVCIILIFPPIGLSKVHALYLLSVSNLLLI